MKVKAILYHHPAFESCELLCDERYIGRIYGEQIEIDSYKDPQRIMITLLPDMNMLHVDEIDDQRGK